VKEKLPRVTGLEITRALERAGFSFARQSGSHAIYKNDSGKRVTIPSHAGKVLHPKVIHAILRDADLTVAELRDFLR
jgi:predicted RNA binding protein YcfA (HicA-like mRNA interferase family)